MKLPRRPGTRRDSQVGGLPQLVGNEVAGAPVGPNHHTGRRERNVAVADPNPLATVAV